MGCESCLRKEEKPKGCKSNGYCATDGCNKLSSYNWLVDMNQNNPENPFNVIEIRFKNGRKYFYEKETEMNFLIGDVVVVKENIGHDLGTVSLTGELVRLQMYKKNVSEKKEKLNKILRKANQKDIDIWQKAQQEEEPMRLKAREIAKKNICWQ